ncbi:ISAzo13 family transposase [Desulfobulbus alkaliphilus]|uniref:ISAzo13 family transposase n=1 Tax=Desulfobulbus alkaliphilus TaxID=869814 RepID=UPI001963D889|nr:ISAzo13 family transposase [Desulfobulbus alkaliphilus]MBM9538859.1 ISAzo13 family transposase [Desulfobulbus alkaliphilus]
MDNLAMLQQKYQLLRPHLDEATMRICAAADAMVLGRGGPSLVAKASGLSRTTVYAGLSDLKQPDILPIAPVRATGRIRRPGGGRKSLTEVDPDLLSDLNRLVDPITRGDPESPLRWTCKSTTKLAQELRDQGHRVSQRTVWTLLDQLGYSMQSNRKAREGTENPDRDAQFLFIANKVEQFQANGLPVISVDTKKKELIGRFKNAGREWQRKGLPEEVNVHDFADKELGKVVPYGVYDLTHNQGWVSVGINHDTAEFAVATIRRWWKRMGVRFYPEATDLLITADGGGSNGSRVRLWKIEIQKLAQELNMTIHVCHFPPGTSKWNKIEHRMFCHISENWRGRPLESQAVVVNLIANTRTNKGLTIKAEIDEAFYPTGIKVPDKDMEQLALIRDEFHGEWNYKIAPKQNP